MNDRRTLECWSDITDWVSNQRVFVWFVFCIILWLTASYLLTAPHTFYGREVKLSTAMHDIVTIDSLVNQSYTLTFTNTEPFIFSDLNHENIITSAIDTASLKNESFYYTTEFTKPIKLIESNLSPRNATIVSVKSSQPIKVIFSNKTRDIVFMYIFVFLLTCLLFMLGYMFIQPY